MIRALSVALLGAAACAGSTGPAKTSGRSQGFPGTPPRPQAVAPTNGHGSHVQGSHANGSHPQGSNGHGPHAQPKGAGGGATRATLGTAPAAQAPAPQPVASAPGSAPQPIPVEPIDPKLEAKAQRLIARGRQLYTKGDYDRAEEALKEAITIHPFVAEANLMLGKIFLIRGSASRDRTMIASARLMFEMARALDPSLREPGILLELFLASPPE